MIPWQWIVFALPFVAAVGCFIKACNAPGSQTGFDLGDDSAWMLAAIFFAIVGFAMVIGSLLI